MVASGSVDYTPHLFGRTKLDTGVFAQHTEYKGADFDDTYISGHIGPSFYWPRTSLSFRPTASYRWFGNTRYNRTVGLRTHLGRNLSRKWSLNATLSYDHVNYFVSDDLDGPVYAGLVVLNYGLSSRSFLRGIFGVSHEDARTAPLRNTEWRLGAGYHRDFAWGIRAYLQPELMYNPYEGIQPAFGQKRTDWQTRVGLSIIKRDIAFLGLSPELRYTFIRNDSSIDFFSYTRHRVEIGFTRRF